MPPEVQPKPSPRELRHSLRVARAANAAYLAEPRPDAAATREQVRVLTEQVDTLVRLTLGG